MSDKPNGMQRLRTLSSYLKAIAVSRIVMGTPLLKLLALNRAKSLGGML